MYILILVAVSTCHSQKQMASGGVSCKDDYIHMYADPDLSGSEPSGTKFLLQDGGVTLNKEDDMDMEAIIRKVNLNTSLFLPTLYSFASSAVVMRCH